MKLTRLYSALTIGVLAVLGYAAPASAESSPAAPAAMLAQAEGNWTGQNTSLPEGMPHGKQDSPAMAPKTGHGQGWYGLSNVGAGVRVRQGGNGCYATPGKDVCPTVVDTLKAGERVIVRCQRLGQKVGTNPYWVFVHTTREKSGFMAGWFINNRTNRIDGVPICP